MLLKTEVVLGIFAKYERDVEFRPHGSEEPQLFLAHEQWKDLGSPADITVTIQPGDVLNQ